MTEILAPEDVVLAASAASKTDAVREAGAVLVRAGAVEPAYVDAMLERERSMSTYMGNFLAIPHGTEEAKGAITRSALCLVRYDEPVDWDGEPVRVVVGIAGVGDEHLEILSRIALVFADMEQVQRVLDAPTAAELYAVLQQVNEE
ncbi:PTS sugar transporter subunit IIA [Cellulomonas cellasea]|uniref:Mannitol-specific phosphotransferase enzyme IIA component n=1 Tax=Cellulomonas cellasea TaxID=43670 RepID=A0A7W4UJN0_9CELL|nr:PTS sugar transporter subunit IIA [Cellulomonas cellasea]MBB2925395.1 PTS system mannitol-specific IIA component [Cellulomonas cellasea]